jgi:hypothetical protein
MYDVQTTPHISSWEIKFAPGVEWLMIHDTCPYTLHMLPSMSTQQGEIRVKKKREYTNYAVENITIDICATLHQTRNIRDTYVILN